MPSHAPRSLTLFMLFLAARAASAAVVNHAEPIVIGEVLSFTGPDGGAGRATDRGVQLLVEEVNARGGVHGRTLVVKRYDDGGEPGAAKAGVRALVKEGRAAAIVGEIASSLSIAMATELDRLNVPMISPGASHPKVTEQSKYAFRACVIDAEQGRLMAAFARHTLALSRVAIIQEVGSDYSKTLADAFSQAFKSTGGTITSTAEYWSRHLDAKATIEQAAIGSPEAIYIPGWYADAGSLAEEARRAGLDIPLLGGDGWDSPKLLAFAGAIKAGYFTEHASVDDPAPAMKDFVDAFARRYPGQKPDIMAVQGYVALQILVSALQGAVDSSGPAVRTALAATRDLPTIGGALTLDEHRNARKPVVILKVGAGPAFQFVQRVAP